MMQALSTFVARGALKLRKEKLLAHSLLIFIRSSEAETQVASLHIPLATAYTPDLIELVHLLLKRIFVPGCFYKKGGIMLSELVDDQVIALDFFTSDQHEKKRGAIDAFDEVNRRYGNGMISFAREGIEKRWSSRSSRRSPNYTTSWEELPVIKLL